MNLIFGIFYTGFRFFLHPVFRFFFKTSSEQYGEYKSYRGCIRIHVSNIIGQRHAKRDLQTYSKSVDSDQPQRLRRRVWSESVLFYTRHINYTDSSCCVSKWITYSCFQYSVWVDLGLHYVKCLKVPFHVSLANSYVYNVYS